MKHIILFSLFVISPLVLFAQLERKLENENQAVELIFHSSRHINLLTVEPLSKKTMHFAIMHTFGTLDGGIENLFGIDLLCLISSHLRLREVVKTRFIMFLVGTTSFSKPRMVASPSL